MLDCIPLTTHDSAQKTLRRLKIAIRAARACLNGNQLEESLIILERAASYDDCLRSRMASQDDEHTRESGRYHVEYICLRITQVSFIDYVTKGSILRKLGMEAK